MIEENREPVVDKYEIKDGQTVVVHIPVNDLQPMQAQNYLQNVIKSFRTELDKKGCENVKLFAFPHHPGKDRPSLEVVQPPPPGSVMIFSVPIGNIPKSEAPKYLKMVKAQLLSEDWDKKYPGVNLLVVGVFEDGRKMEVSVSG